jgi:hypothetical protein
MMNLEMAQLAEGLAKEFTQVPATTVIQVLTDCLDEFPDASGLFIEQAARSRLQALARR